MPEVESRRRSPHLWTITEQSPRALTLTIAEKSSGGPLYEYEVTAPNLDNGPLYEKSVHNNLESALQAAAVWLQAQDLRDQSEDEGQPPLG